MMSVTGFDFARLHATQARHPVVPVVSLDRLVALGRDRAVALVNDRQGLIDRMTPEHESADLLRSSYDPPAWRRIDLEVARKRLAFPGACLEVFVLGGHDSGKTHGAVMRLSRHFFYTPRAWIWGLHDTEDSSKTIHQARVWQFIPPEMKSRVGKSGGMKRELDTKFKYGDGQGFTNNQFNVKWDVAGLPWVPLGTRVGPDGKVKCGGLCQFKFFESKNKSLQGSKLTCASSDELVDKEKADTVRQRLIPRAVVTAEPEFLLQIAKCVKILEDVDANGHPRQALPAKLQGLLYTGVHVMGFTPMDGYSPLVASALDGAETLETVDAKLLPILGEGGRPTFDADGRQRFKQVPRFKQPKSPTQLVAYLHTPHNPWTNVEGKIADCLGKPETYVRVTFYGDVEKDWAVKFPTFRNQVMPLGHVATRAMVPRTGTWYHDADFATGRPWFMSWTLVDPQQRKWICREWPQKGDCIPEKDGGGSPLGDPGEWARTSEHGKHDGDPGPAQQSKFRLGFGGYKREFARIEAEIGRWWSKDGAPITVYQRSGDSRLGNNPTTTNEGSTSIINEMEALDVAFDSASGKCLQDGDDLITNSLEYDASQPMGPLNTPKLMVLEECHAIRFALQIYSGLDGAKAATKDPRDVVGMMLLGSPEDMTGVQMVSYVR